MPKDRKTSRVSVGGKGVIVRILVPGTDAGEQVEFHSISVQAHKYTWSRPSSSFGYNNYLVWMI